ncbi:MAG: Crp/Fnr family transcriptional regulator [Ferruginibacter sp.]
MHASLRQHIEKFIEFNDGEMLHLLSCFRSIQLKKKQYLLEEGKICKDNYFVVKGCLRLFFINEKGIEQTTQFAIENWWLSDYSSFDTQQPSGFNIQAVEPTEVIAIGRKEQESMLQQHPAMERYFRIMHQRANAAAQFRIKLLYSLSREAMYLQFNKKFPEFVQRVPQYLLASFLGITPEYLSEIRSKKLS